MSVFSIAYAVLSPVLAALTGTWSRRAILSTALVVLGAGNVVTALAPNYSLVLVASVLAAAGASMFTPTPARDLSLLRPGAARRPRRP